jgi:integrase/recombinase XerD
MKNQTQNQQSNQPSRDSIWWILLNRYLDWMSVKNFSPFTIHARRKDVSKFIIWAEERELQPKQITLSEIERYQSKLSKQVTRKGTIIQANSQGRILTAIKSFFSYLAKVKYLDFNPATEIEFPKEADRLPKHILTHKEVELVMSMVSLKDHYAIRDRAMLELIYSTGIRRMEVAQLKVKDLDLYRGFLFIRAGKGLKDRFIPLGQRAKAWLELYLKESRPKLLAYRDRFNDAQKVEELFLTRYAEAFKIGGIGTIVKYYLGLAQIPEGSCHMLRHTMATLMLENGADIRYIQQMLGHSNLTTTQVYTKVSDRMLEQVHSRTHPGARLLANKDAAYQIDEPEQIDEVEENSDQ